MSKYWGDLKDYDLNPRMGDLVPCRLCNQKCMVAEYTEDRDDRGLVIRIYSNCDRSLSEDKDDIRTEFDTPENAIKEWNNRFSDKTTEGN